MSRRRTALVVTACLAGSAVLVTGGLLLAQQKGDPAEADGVSHSVTTSTAKVEKGDLKGVTTKTGTIEGTAGAKVSGGPAGTLTSIPAVGTVVKPRDVLYRVDDRPVTFLAGDLPQWRAFEDGMSDGPDIEQLEQNLRDWGYLDQVATRHFDWHTRVALQKWQKDTGQDRSGRVDLGSVWFGQGDQVVADRSLAAGDQVQPGATVYTTTGVTKVVTVPLPVGSPLAKTGGVVEVVLPTSGRKPGKVTAVGDPVTDDDGKTTAPVTVSLDDPAAAADLDKVEVSVDFVSETRHDVLSVPVTSLGAAAEGGFVVDVVTGGGTPRPVPVTLGLFAGDRVEITAGAVRRGDEVVVPA